MNTQDKNRYLRTSLSIVRILFALVFIFSGFVKAIDPLGSTYKFEDYFQSFGGFFNNLTPFSFYFSILLSAVEWTIGWCLLLRISIRSFTFIGLLFMLIMTPLTLYLAIKNPVSDCGCFGDAIVISNWVTFYKNLVLITLITILFIERKKIFSLFKLKIQTTVMTVIICIPIGLSLFCYSHLPLIDFLPYKVGVNIPKAMEIPQNAAADKFETTFIYSKNGVEKEFTLQNYPKGDSTWKFVDQKTKLIKQGYRPPIHDFAIVNEQMEDITDKIIYNAGKTYLMVITNLEKAPTKGLKKAEALYQKAIKEGIDFYAISASSDEEIKAVKARTGITFPFCKADLTMLKTMIRANPGLVELQQGTITRKSNWRDL